MFRRRDQRSERLEGIPILEGCGRDELRTVSELSELVTYEPGSVLIEEDSLGGEAFVIVDGSVVVTRGGETLATLETGSVLGEAALLDWWAPPRDQRSKYTSGRRTATVTASEEAPVEALVFDPRGFETLRDEVPIVARRLLSEMSRRFRVDDEGSDEGSDSGAAPA